MSDKKVQPCIMSFFQKKAPAAAAAASTTPATDENQKPPTTADNDNATAKPASTPTAEIGTRRERDELLAPPVANNANAAAPAVAVAAGGAGGVGAVRPLEDLDGLLADCPAATATSVAGLFQDADGAAFFTVVLKASFDIWPKDSPCTYGYWCDVLADVSAISGRNLVMRRLTFGMLAMLLRGTQQELVQAFYLSVNEVAPAHEGVEIGVGDATLMSVVAEISGMNLKRLREEYSKTGDLAEIAQKNKKRQATLVTPKPLQLAGVFKAFRGIACTSGKDTQRKRGDMIKVLMRDAKGPEVNFIVRALQGKMRIGMGLNSLLAALGYALALFTLVKRAEHEDRAGAQADNQRNIPAWDKTKLEVAKLQQLLTHFADAVSQAYHQCPAIEDLVSTIFAAGGACAPKDWLDKLNIRAGVPCRPMLAQPTTGVRQILDRFTGKAFTCEFKYDGERGQVHYVRGAPADKQFSMYSRNSESYTTKFPDVINGLPLAFDDDVTSFIMDGEVVACDSATGRLRPFQVLQGRGKKNVQIEDVTVHVKYFAFDLLMLNGESLLNLPLRRRRAILRETFKECAMLGYAKNKDSDDVEEIQHFLEHSVQEGCEGLMVKTLDDNATYTPCKRSSYWLKLKKDYMEGGVGDTLDLVPVGAYLGKGKRTGLYGGFLLACYDVDQDEFQSICKIGTGFSDADLQKFHEQLSETATAAPTCNVPDALAPDVWFSPQYVWEVRAADLSLSPVHQAALGQADPARGIALRFPRFMKVREDKTTNDATSSQQVCQMYRSQALVAADAAANAGGAGGDDEYDE